MDIEEAKARNMCRNCHNWNKKESDCTLDLVCEKSRYCEQCKTDLPTTFNLVRKGELTLELCDECYKNRESMVAEES
jgi:hypothetical protein